jgi:hypothetical protein
VQRLRARIPRNRNGGSRCSRRRCRCVRRRRKELGRWCRSRSRCRSRWFRRRRFARRNGVSHRDAAVATSVPVGKTLKIRAFCRLGGARPLRNRPCSTCLVTGSTPFNADKR